jgi:hypothetical protein
VEAKVFHLKNCSTFFIFIIRQSSQLPGRNLSLLRKRVQQNFLIPLYSLSKFANEKQRELGIVIKIFVVRISTELIIRILVATFIFTAVSLSLLG